MVRAAIRVENLSKRYRLGARQQRYATFREALRDTALTSLRRLVGRRGPTAAPEFVWALRNVSFDVEPGDAVGIIGRNGAGKSTLLKVLSLITEPTSGRVEIRGRVGSLLEVGTGFHPELTGRENVFLNGAILGMGRAEISRKFDEIVGFAEVERFLDTPVKRYSSGMYVRLAFAVAAHLEPEILLVDEVLAVGDAAFQRKCLGKMGGVAKQGRTVFFVSHNIGAVSNLCNKGLVLEDGQAVFAGTARDAIHNYNHSLLHRDGGRNGQAPHVLYAGPTEPAQREFAVTRIEVLDADGRPKPVVSTWDDVVFRITYRCTQQVRAGSVELTIAAADIGRVLLLTTQPDGTCPLEFKPGEHRIDCRVAKLPLAAGEYAVGAALAIPNVQWLWQGQDLGSFTVVPRDVYGSGYAPEVPRTLLAVEHHWQPV
jgi:lipopolysaccharide transport system ATP-binding protein